MKRQVSGDELSEEPQKESSSSKESARCTEETKFVEGHQNTNILRRVAQCIIRRKGVIISFASAILMALYGLLTKFISPAVDASMFNFYQSLALVVAAGPILIWKKLSLRQPKRVWSVMIIRATFGTLCSILFFYAMQLLDLSTAKSLYFTGPIFATAFGRLCLKESCSFVNVTCAIVSVVGIFLVVQPSAIFGDISPAIDRKSDFYFGVAAAITAAMFNAMALVSSRELGRLKINAHLVSFVFGLTGIAASVLSLTVQSRWSNLRCGGDRFFMMMLSGNGVIIVILVLMALETESTALVAIIRTSDVVITFFLDTIVLKTSPNAITVVGGLLVVASVIAITLSSCRKARTEIE
ncbi:solute carrier family 35 member G1-like [Diadema antillarum]|uniref:solute carrier family 35 member G1-like n=1 Tax=Diadema antillarum TaxID=105358 RepID=UPI003A89BF41